MTSTAECWLRILRNEVWHLLYQFPGGQQPAARSSQSGTGKSKLKALQLPQLQGQFRSLSCWWSLVSNEKYTLCLPEGIQDWNSSQMVPSPILRAKSQSSSSNSIFQKMTTNSAVKVLFTAGNTGKCVLLLWGSHCYKRGTLNSHAPSYREGIFPPILWWISHTYKKSGTNTQEEFFLNSLKESLVWWKN